MSALSCDPGWNPFHVQISLGGRFSRDADFDRDVSFRFLLRELGCIRDEVRQHLRKPSCIQHGPLGLAEIFLQSECDVKFLCIRLEHLFQLVEHVV